MSPLVSSGEGAPPPALGKPSPWRQFSIPAMSALVLSATGCSDPIVGEWTVTEMNGEDLPQTYTDSGGGYTYTYGYSARMIVWPDLMGQFRLYYSETYSGDDGHGEWSYGYAHSAEITAEGKRRYTIEVEGDDLDCELTSGVLECDFDGGGDMVLERDDP